MKKILIGIVICSITSLLSVSTIHAESQSINLAVTYNKSVPDFPKSIKNYKLQKKSQVSSIRVFQSDKNWNVPIPQFDPTQNGGATMSCQPFFWILRWRTNDPKIAIQATRGLTDNGFEPTEKFLEGGAGYESGSSCEVPALRFGKTTYPAKKGVTLLVDVNFEYEIWSYNPKI